jgi:hypothetical protein
MKKTISLFVGLSALALVTGCATIPPGAERGPAGTMAYDILVEASEPGARIEVNREFVGNSPVHVKVFADPDGTFHDFGSPYYTIQALPVTTNQYPQGRTFMTGQFFSGEDRVPQRVYFDMSQPPPPTPPPTQYVYPYGPPPAYYGPPPVYYYPPSYHRPGVRLYFGPSHGHGHYHRRW